MRVFRPASDVSALPTVTFGSQSLMWWAAAGFMVTEGWSIVLLLATYFYLRQNYYGWPPPPLASPRLGLPTLNVVLMAVSCWPALTAQRAAQRLDTNGIRWSLVWGSILGI